MLHSQLGLSQVGGVGEKFLSRPSELRPTQDRVRETLFNWIDFDIAGATCLIFFLVVVF